MKLIATLMREGGPQEVAVSSLHLVDGRVVCFRQTGITVHYDTVPVDDKLLNIRVEPESKLKHGDVVRLKSGGPKMTIVRRLTDESEPHVIRWTCVWFEARGGEKHTVVFPEAALQNDGPPEEVPGLSTWERLRDPLV